jgi:hypothetical protein
MTFAIATQVSLPASGHRHGDVLTEMGEQSAAISDLVFGGSANAHARALSSVEQRVMHGLRHLRSADAALSAAQAGFARVLELTLQAERTHERTLDQDLLALVSELGRVASDGEVDGLPWLGGAVVSLDLPLGRARLHEAERVSVLLPDVAAALFDPAGLAEVELGHPLGPVRIRAIALGLLSAIRASRAQLGSTVERCARTLCALRADYAQVPGNALGSNESSLEAAPLQPHAAILAAAGRSLRAQANLSPRAALLLEAS